MQNPVRLLNLVALASGTPVDTITVKQKMIERAYEAAHIQIQRLKWKNIIFWCCTLVRDKSNLDPSSLAFDYFSLSGDPSTSYSVWFSLVPAAEIVNKFLSNETAKTCKHRPLGQTLTISIVSDAHLQSTRIRIRLQPTLPDRPKRRPPNEIDRRGKRY